MEVAGIPCRSFTEQIYILIGQSRLTQKVAMNFRTHLSRSLGAIATALLLASTTLATTIVRFETNLGSIDVRLYEEATPLSVANFLNYVNTDSWDGTFVHRSIPGFIVQGGGFSLTPDIFNTTNVTTNPAVLNEPGISNLRGTLAYAKQGGDPNSATSQWFFNLDNNSANLDFQNGGFTVFGRVVGNGMTVVDSIAALETIGAGGAFSDVPVLDRQQVINQQNIFPADAVVFSDISVISTLDGDYNFDGTVDNADWAVFNSDFGSTLKAEADGNGDGIVDGTDFLLWQQNFGATSSLATVQSIPEPSTLALAALGTLTLLYRR